MRKYLPDLLFVAGYAVIVTGLWMIHAVAGVLAAGAGLMGAGYLLASGNQAAIVKRKGTLTGSAEVRKHADG